MKFWRNSSLFLNKAIGNDSKAFFLCPVHGLGGWAMMTTEFQKGIWGQEKSPRRPKSPEESKCENVCLLLALG